MRDRPSALELLEAVNEFLAAEVLPLMDDHRMKFRTLVALNALGIAYREVAAVPGDRAAGEELSGLPRTVETARIVAPGLDPESWPELREIESGRLADIAEDELERVFLRAFH